MNSNFGRFNYFLHCASSLLSIASRSVAARSSTDLMYACSTMLLHDLHLRGWSKWVNERKLQKEIISTEKVPYFHFPSHWLAFSGRRNPLHLFVELHLIALKYVPNSDGSQHLSHSHRNIFVCNR